jgi:preprotein translocase subunit SecA
LIISGVPKVQSNLYGIADSFIQIINEDDDYELSENFKNVWFTPEGIAHINAYFGLDDVLSEDNRELYRHLVIALKAHKLFKRDREYVVDDGEVVLVDRANGRELTGMKLESGMHQALEAKEGVHVTPEMRTMASVTYQNLFRMFSQLAGMTGTAATDRSEFMETYRLAVVKVPTNRPNIRKDLPDQLFISNAAKLTASLQVVREAYTHERPLLIETGSLALSNLYSRLLLQERIPHNLLNARAAAKEARIIAEAGQTGAVTVATSMAGRGTDIHLSDQAKKAGGLLVLGTERMSSARVDNQLRGRAGRQGEPGASQFFVSLEDRVVIENAPRRVRLYTEKHANQPQQALNRRGRFGRVIDHAQGADSASQRSARFSTLQYGEVFRVQRDKVYATRDAVMAASDLSGVIAQVIAQAQQDFFATPQDAASTLAYIYENVDRDYRPDDLQQHPELGADPAFLARVMQARMAQQRQFLPANDQWQYFLRLVILKAIDAAWIEQVDHLQSLRSVTMNRSTAQHDPVFEYQKEARAAFARMRADMNARIARFLMCSELERTPDGQVDVSFP